MLVTGHRELFPIQINRKNPTEIRYKVILDHYKPMLSAEETILSLVNSAGASPLSLGSAA